MSAYQKRVYMLAMALLLFGSVYPILMGISVFSGAHLVWSGVR